VRPKAGSRIGVSNCRANTGQGFDSKMPLVDGMAMCVLLAFTVQMRCMHAKTSSQQLAIS